MVRIPRRKRIIISRTTDLECLSLSVSIPCFYIRVNFDDSARKKPFKFSGSSLSPKRRLARKTLRLSKIQYILMGFYFRYDRILISNFTQVNVPADTQFTQLLNDFLTL